MSKCSFCEEPPILTSGRKYCKSHIYLYDRDLLNHILMEPESEINKFVDWAFGVVNFTFSCLPNAYHILPHIWDPKGNKFKVPQTEYIKQLFNIYKMHDRKED